MSVSCWNSHRTVVSATMCAAVLLAASAQAALIDEVKTFLADRDRLIALRTEIADDRAAMAANLNNESELRKSVREFFRDRATAGAVKLIKALDRRDMKFALGYQGTKLTKPTKGTGILAMDAASCIANYDKWIALQQTVEANIEQMRADANAGDEAALMISTTAFFDNSRLRHQARLQWQMDIRSMKKDVAFKGTGKPLGPPGSTLQEHTAEFLNDRAAWEALALTVEADRNNIRATLNDAASLESAVTTFLTDRRARRLKGIELAADRKAMRQDLGLRGADARELKSGAELSAKDIDSDDEEGALEESSDEAGEK